MSLFCSCRAASGKGGGTPRLAKTDSLKLVTHSLFSSVVMQRRVSCSAWLASSHFCIALIQKSSSSEASLSLAGDCTGSAAAAAAASVFGRGGSGDVISGGTWNGPPGRAPCPSSDVAKLSWRWVWAYAISSSLATFAEQHVCITFHCRTHIAAWNSSYNNLWGCCTSTARSQDPLRSPRQWHCRPGHQP